MSINANALQRLVAAYLEAERVMRAALSLEEVQRAVEAERVAKETAKGATGAATGTARR